MPVARSLDALEHQILDLRDVGNSIMGIQAWESGSVEDAARRFGLLDNPGIYRAISAEEAEQVLVWLLRRDMVHRQKLMPRAQAQHFAAELMTHLAAPGAAFYTNGPLIKTPDNPGGEVNWTAVSDCTFDSGVLALAPGRIACAWFQEED